MNFKVIATTWNEGRDIRVPPHELKFPDHYQNVSGFGDSLRRMKDIIAFEMDQDPGAPYDLVIVRSGATYKEGDDYLLSLDGTKTPWGTIHVILRENTGWSFGAFNAAYQKFKDNYGYWLFTEEDIMVGGKHYYDKLIEKFNSKEGIGYVALTKICNHTYGVHAGGGIGLTHSKVLAELDRWLGMLPHHSLPDDPKLDFMHVRHNIIINGEVPFTNKILKLGYDLVAYGDEKEWNLEKNLCLPYFNYQNALPKS
jgi:hypothetical protein